MVELKLSDTFKVNLLYFKIFGIWWDRNSHILHKYYSAIFLCVNLFIYNMLLIFNLAFIPRKIEMIIPEFNYLFTEVSVTAKVLMILIMRSKLLATFDVLDSDVFRGDDEPSRHIVAKYVYTCKIYWKMFVILSHFAYFCQVCLPIIVHLIFNTHIELPICKYYFLDDEVVKRYFVFCYIYQSFGIYGHMQYNINVDTLNGGFLMMAISQVQVLKYKMKNFKVTKSSCGIIKEEVMEMVKLNKCLKHYETLLNFCSLVQDVIGITMFVQFTMASIIICVMMCELLLPSTVGELMFKISYIITIVLQIFAPAWLGTQLSHQSQQLVSAAYSSEWIPRTERFKRSLKLFMVRANTNIVITGWRLFPLSLDTFTSIMKTAYSFFTLVKNVHDRQLN